MYMRSMTGFGRAEGTICGLMIEVVVRSVNHKSLDINFRLPRRLYPMEAAMKECLQKEVSRGRVEVFVQIRTGDAPLSHVTLDTARADGVKHALDEMQRRYGMKEPVRLQDLLLVPDLLMEEPTNLDEGILQEGLLLILQEALDAFVAMRKQEAEGLRAQLDHNIRSIKESITGLQGVLPEIQKEAKEKLEKKVEDFLKDNPDWQEGRVQQELLFYLDKSDVQEELTRLSSHVAQFGSLLDTEGPVGKKLDFLCQEMNREANTIASKSQHLKQTDAAINLKVDIEQMREQIMNLE